MSDVEFAAFCSVFVWKACSRVPAGLTLRWIEFGPKTQDFTYTRLRKPNIKKLCRGFAGEASRFTQRWKVSPTYGRSALLRFLTSCGLRAGMLGNHVTGVRRAPMRSP
eukprot:2394768-Prymnesium_polylepis.1